MTLDVSVILPVYNGASLITEALRSVFEQTAAPAEVIVIDDGSTDDTAAVLARAPWPLTILHQENAGPSAARNRGIEASTGQLIAFIDADDAWLPNKLELQHRLLGEHPEAEVIMGLTEGVALDAPSRALRGFPAAFSARHLVQLGSTLFRRSVLDRVGLFDERLRFGEDMDWFIRASEAKVTIHAHDDVVQHYRRHQSNMTNDVGGRDRGFMQALHNSIRRRREARSQGDGQ